MNSSSIYPVNTSDRKPLRHAEKSVTLYSAVDDILARYRVDVESATLQLLDSTRLPAKLQYAWPHPHSSSLLLSTSNGGPRVVSDNNQITAMSVQSDGSLTPLGPPVEMKQRAVHMCIDPSGEFSLNAHNFPASNVTVHRLGDDGSVGDAIPQQQGLDFGIYPHQVMVFPSGRTVLIADRGNKAQGEKAEEPGALRTYGFEDGLLTPGQVIAPGGGYGFGPRHVVFHPTRPWLYVSDERTNRLYMFRLNNDQIEPTPAFTLDTLREPTKLNPRQIAGPIHIHPAGLCVYVANRADHHVLEGQTPIFTSGENNIAVFSINPQTGEPSIAQHADTQSFHVRTFSMSPNGHLLVTASIKMLHERSGESIQPVPAALSVFRVDAQGKLKFERKYNVQTSGAQLQYWMGIISHS